MAIVLDGAAVEYIQKLDLRYNIIIKLKLRTGFRENYFISFYHQVILDQELPPLGFLIALFPTGRKKKRFSIKVCIMELIQLKSTPNQQNYQRNYSIQSNI